MRIIRLIGTFIRLSVQEEMAHRANFLIAIFHSLLGVGTGIVGLWVLFAQVESIEGWTFAMTLALLGIYLMLEAVRQLFIEPSLDALAGMGGAIWEGRFDFMLLHPINTQFLVSIHRWRLLAGFDLLVALAVLMTAIRQLEQRLAWTEVAAFLLALLVSVTILYSLLLGLTSLLFFSPGFFYTWIFNSVVQMARYPLNLYPGWLRLLLTWVLPVGLMTTLPVQALTHNVAWPVFGGGILLALLLFVGASGLFHLGLRRYASASS